MFDKKFNFKDKFCPNVISSNKLIETFGRCLYLALIRFADNKEKSPLLFDSSIPIPHNVLKNSPNKSHMNFHAKNNVLCYSIWLQVTGNRLGAILQSVFTIVLAVCGGIYYEWRLGLAGASYVPMLLLSSTFHAKIIASHDNIEKEALARSAKVSSRLSQCLQITKKCLIWIFTQKILFILFLSRGNSYFPRNSLCKIHIIQKVNMYF